MNKKNLYDDFCKIINEQIGSEIYLKYFRLWDLLRKKLIDDLIKKMKIIEEMTKNLKSFSDIFGRFWDLSEHDLYKMDDSFLLKLENLLKEQSFIKQIAEMLGRLAYSQKAYEEYLIKDIKFCFSNKKWYYSPENITSIKFGNEISSILKYQLILRKYKLTKNIFNYNYAEKKLLELEQKTKMLDEVETTKKEKRFKQENKGPFIMCVDTSGSMHGEPENIAKALCLCIFKIAKQEDRKCYIINFSTGIVEFDASDVNSNFSKFYDFLRMSFSGGTDVEPALKRACEKCLEQNYKNADIIVISDFIINQISDQLNNQIEKLKKQQVRFNALSIGCSQISEHTKFFDTNLVYDGTQESIDKIIQKLNKLKDEANKKVY